MRPWRDAVHDGLISGSAASVASTAALAAAGAIENGSSAAPLNAVSHWVWGRRALYRDRATARFTLGGYAIHHAASVFWAVLYERYVGRPRSTAEVVAGAAVVAGLACAVDSTVRPRRLRPGFKTRLSRGALLGVYAAFGAGLALSTLMRER